MTAISQSRSWPGRLSFTAVLAVGLVVGLPGAAQAETRSFTNWFNSGSWPPDITTSSEYVDKIAGLFGLTAADPIDDTDLATVTGPLSLVGSDIPNGYPTNISLLSGLTQLFLADSQPFEDATTLTGELPNLAVLELTRTGVEDITGLTCDNLTTLVVADSLVQDTALPASCTSLTRLSLAGNPIDDLTGLPALPALEELDLSGLNPSGGADIDLRPLARYAPTLTSLDLSSGDLLGLDGLEALTSLTYLNLAANQIQDPAALETLTNLEVLDLRWNDIDDKTVITSLRTALPDTTILLAGNPLLPSFAITTPSALPDGTVGTAYSHTLAAEDSERAAVPATWEQTGGQLPPGLSLDPVSGTISGTPTAAGTFTVDIDATYGQAVDDPPFTVVIAPAADPVPDPDPDADLERTTTEQDALPATGSPTTSLLASASALLLAGLAALWLHHRRKDLT